MKTLLISIKDSITGEFSTITIVKNEQEAFRAAKLLVSKPSDDLKFKLNDLQLYSLGSYDNETGEIVPNVKFIINLIDCVEVKSND